MILYLTGIDGSGKSTIAKEIKEKLSKETTCKLIWARYEPKFVKFLLSPIKNNYFSKRRAYNSMTSKEYARWSQYKKEITKNKLISRVLFCIQYIEYNYQIRKILPTKNNTNLIIDRFVLDFIVDQTINHGNIEESIWVKKLLKKVDQIDRVVFLDVDENVAFSRKTDIPSVEYLSERRKIYKTYIKKMPNGHIIDNNGNIKNTLKAIENIL